MTVRAVGAAALDVGRVVPRRTGSPGQKAGSQ